MKVNTSSRNRDLRNDEKSSVSTNLKGLFDILMVCTCSGCIFRYEKSIPPDSLVGQSVEQHLQVVLSTTVVSNYSAACNKFETRIKYHFRDRIPLAMYRIEIDYGPLGQGNHTQLIERRLPRDIVIFGTPYELFAATLIQPPNSRGAIAHFVAIFYTNEEKYLFDGCNKAMQRLKQDLKIVMSPTRIISGIGYIWKESS